MSVLEFLDVFRMFLGELDNRQYDAPTRQATLDVVIGSLKDVLDQVEGGGAAPAPYVDPYAQQQQQQQQQQQYADPPQQQQQYGGPPPQQQQQYGAPPPQQQQQQHYQQAPPPQQQQQHYQQAPPPQQQQAPPPQQPQQRQHPSQSSMAMGAQEQPQYAGDEQALSEISAAVYGTGLKLMSVYKQMNTSGDGINDQQLVEGLHKLGCTVPGHTIVALSGKFKGGNGKLTYSGLVRMLATAPQK